MTIITTFRNLFSFGTKGREEAMPFFSYPHIDENLPLGRIERTCDSIDLKTIAQLVNVGCTITTPYEFLDPYIVELPVGYTCILEDEDIQSYSDGEYVISWLWLTNDQYSTIRCERVLN